MQKEQIDAFCGVVRSVVGEDIGTWQRGPVASCAHLQALMLQHSVERPPWSHASFDPVQATYAFDFMLTTYYAHFYLYKHCLSAVPVLRSVQEDPAGIPLLRAPRPLAEAILVQPLPPLAQS
jgi:hypothetical protein